MAWPDDGKFSLAVELWDGAAWDDITSYVRHEQGIDITRGRTSESGQCDPASMRLRLDDRDGRFNPYNPMSPYYGVFTQGALMRYRVSEGHPWIPVVAAGTNYATMPYDADLDSMWSYEPRSIRVSFRADDILANGTRRVLVSRWETGAYSWRFAIEDGYPKFTWSVDGTSGSAETLTGTTQVGLTSKRPGALRVDIGISTGLGVSPVTFYEANYVDSTEWTQVGPVLYSSDIITPFETGQGLQLGGGAGLAGLDGRIYQLRLISGSPETTWVDLDVGKAEPGDATITDDTGFVWTFHGDDITNTQSRFTGEVVSIQRGFTPGGDDVWVDVEVGGALRAARQVKTDPHSVMWRGIGECGTLIDYWPMENPQDGVPFESAIGGPDLDSSNAVAFTVVEPFECSEPIAQLGAGWIDATFAARPSTGYIAVSCLVSCPSGGETDNRQMIMLDCTGTALIWGLEYNTGGELTVYAWNAAGTAVVNDGPAAAGLNGNPSLVLLELTQVGANVSYACRVMQVGSDAWDYENTGTLNSYTIGNLKRVTLNAELDLETIAFGHVAAFSAVDADYESRFAGLLRAYDGEAAADRIARLCAEEVIDVTVLGYESAEMGPQTVSEFVDLINECELCDGGVLYDPKDAVEIRYRTRASMAASEPMMVIPFAWLVDATPVADDKSLVNEVTANRTSGGSYTVFRAMTGDYPFRHDTLDVNCNRTSQLKDIAGWLVNLGACTDERWPVVSIELARQPSELTWWEQSLSEALVLSNGDRIRITDVPTWIGYDDIDLIVQGYREFTDGYTYRMHLDCTPGAPWRVGRYAGDDETIMTTARYSADEAFLDTDILAADTTIYVNSSGNILFTTDVVEMPFDVMVGGERMTVTAVSGTSTPQDFTVTRSVNGVVKAHASGTPLELFNYPVFG